MSHASTPISLRPAREAVRRDSEQMGVGANLLQGTAFIGFLLLLFVLAGFRG